MNRRHLLATSLFAIGLVINPAYFLGCAGEEELEFDYGEEEMLGLLDDFNAESWTVESKGVAYAFEVSLSQVEGEDHEAARRRVAASAQTAHACGGKRRVFGASASACATVYDTRLPVEGTLRVSTMKNGETSVLLDGDVEGELVVDGHQFARGQLRVSLQGLEGSVALEIRGTTFDGHTSSSLFRRDSDGDEITISGDITPASAPAN